MKELLLHNWGLKLLSLAAALLLWRVAAPSPSSETGITVPLEFRNIPANAEVYGDTATSVEVRLRGPSSLLRTVSAKDIAVAIDLKGMGVGQQRVLPLTPDIVTVPLGTEAVRVVPARVRFSVESTLSKIVRIEPVTEGTPAEGLVVDSVAVRPADVEIQGPASRVSPIEWISTAPISLTGRAANFSTSVDLDVADDVVRIPRSISVVIDVQLRRPSP